MLVGEELMVAVEAVNALPEVAAHLSAERSLELRALSAENNRPLLR